MICKEMNWRNEEREKKQRERERKKKVEKKEREKKVGEINNNIFIFFIFELQCTAKDGCAL